jgi:hypothetical protein
MLPACTMSFAGLASRSILTTLVWEASRARDLQRKVVYGMSSERAAGEALANFFPPSSATQGADLLAFKPRGPCEQGLRHSQLLRMRLLES